MYDAVQRIHVDLGAAKGARHVGVHLGHHVACRPHGLTHHIHRHAHGTPAVTVGRAHLDERPVQRVGPGEKAGSLMKMHRDNVGTPLPHSRTHVGTNKQRHMPKRPGVLGSHVGRRPKGEDVEHPHIAQVGASGGEGLHQCVRRRRTRSDEHPLATSHVGHGLCC